MKVTVRFFSMTHSIEESSRPTTLIVKKRNNPEQAKWHQN